MRGGCIHVPPPPPNKTVHVVLARDAYRGKSFDRVTVTGTIEKTP